MKTCQYCSKALDDSIPHWTTIDKKGNPESYTCNACFKEAKIKEYIETGEFTNTLTIDANSCKLHAVEFKDGFEGLRQEYRDYYTKHLDTLLRIAYDYEEVQAAGRALELAWWLPVLQPYYNDTDIRGHSAKGKGYKALLWGCAGRVLLTLQDNLPKGKGKFGGANVTLIFDESSKEARGGIQGIAATKGEALALIKAAMEEMPKMKPDKKVTMAGL